MGIQSSNDRTVAASSPAWYVVRATILRTCLVERVLATRTSTVGITATHDQGTRSQAPEISCAPVDQAYVHKPANMKSSVAKYSWHLCADHGDGFPHASLPQRVLF